MAIEFIPNIQCAKCGGPVRHWRRMVDPKTGARVIQVNCHGATTVIPFASAPGQSVEVFGQEEASSEPKEEPEPAPVQPLAPLAAQPAAALPPAQPPKDALTADLENGASRIASARVIASAIIDGKQAQAALKRERGMKDVLGLPDSLNQLVAQLNSNARAALEGLNTAKEGHAEALTRVKRVAEVINEATKKTNAFVDDMLGTGNGGQVAGNAQSNGQGTADPLATNTASTNSSQASAA